MKRVIAIVATFVLAGLLASVVVAQEPSVPQPPLPVAEYKTTAEKIEAQQKVLEGQIALRASSEKKIEELQAALSEADKLQKEAEDLARAASNNPKVASSEYEKHLGVARATQMVHSTVEARVRKAQSALEVLRKQIDISERELALLKIEDRAAELINKTN
jgi:hypothetical protein